MDPNKPHQQVQVVIPSKELKGKRKRERDREEAAFIMDNLKSGDFLLFLQEVPKAKMSHCRAWSCMPYRRTGSPVIRSNYRLKLGNVSASSTYEIKYYHVTCLERFLPDLPGLVRDGYLKMDGYISAPLDSGVCIQSSAEAVADWFRYEGSTFDLGCYERFNKDHYEWETDWSVRCIDHQLGHQEEPDSECNFCQSLPIPEEPKKSDYFPEEPSKIMLSQLLASVSAQSHIDKWWRWRKRG